MCALCKGVSAIIQNKTYRANDITYNSGYVGFTQPGITKTYHVSESRIKVEELDSIEVYGISKIRIGNRVNYIEEEWTNNPLGKFLIKCRKKILERLKNLTAKKSDKGTIYDDF